MKLDPEFLQTKVLRGLWHEVKYLGMGMQCCLSCDGDSHTNPTFDNPNDFFLLFDHCKKQEWWPLFLCTLYYHDYSGGLCVDNVVIIHTDYINPERFSLAVQQFAMEMPELFEGGE